MQKNNLLELDGRNTLKQLVDRSKSTERLVKQAKLHSLKYTPRYKYSFEVPKNYKDAEQLDKRSNNHNWMNVNKLEHGQLPKFNIFKDKGRFVGCKISRGYQLI